MHKEGHDGQVRTDRHAWAKQSSWTLQAHKRSVHVRPLPLRRLMLLPRRVQQLGLRVCLSPRHCRRPHTNRYRATQVLGTVSKRISRCGSPSCCRGCHWLLPRVRGSTVPRFHGVATTPLGSSCVSRYCACHVAFARGYRVVFSTVLPFCLSLSSLSTPLQ